MTGRALVSVALVAVLVVLGGTAWRASRAAMPAAVAGSALTAESGDAASTPQPVSLVGFYQPFCGPCIPALRALSEAARRARVPAVAYNEASSAEDLRGFAEAAGVTGLHYRADVGARAAQRLGVRELETVLILDRDGGVVRRLRNPDADRIVSALDQVRS